MNPTQLFEQYLATKAKDSNLIQALRRELIGRGYKRYFGSSYMSYGSEEEGDINPKWVLHTSSDIYDAMKHLESKYDYEDKP